MIMQGLETSLKMFFLQFDRPRKLTLKISRGRTVHGLPKKEKKKQSLHHYINVEVSALPTVIFVQSLNSFYQFLFEMHHVWLNGRTTIL